MIDAMPQTAPQAVGHPVQSFLRRHWVISSMVAGAAVFSGVGAGIGAAVGGGAVIGAAIGAPAGVFAGPWVGLAEKVGHALEDFWGGF